MSARRAAWGFVAVLFLVLMRAVAPALAAALAHLFVQAGVCPPPMRLPRPQVLAGAAGITCGEFNEIDRIFGPLQACASVSAASLSIFVFLQVWRRRAEWRQIGCGAEYPRDLFVISLLSRVFSAIGDSCPISGCFQRFVILWLC